MALHTRFEELMTVSVLSVVHVQESVLKFLYHILKVLGMAIDALGHFETGHTLLHNNYSTMGRDRDVGSARYKLAHYFPHANHKSFKLQ